MVTDCGEPGQITPKVLREFFLDKGIYISEKSSREEIIKEISVYNLDYHDVQTLIEQMATSARKEKMRSVDIDVGLDASTLNDIAATVKNTRSDENHESYQSYVIPNTDRVVLNVEYDEVDLSKNRLRQRRKRESSIEVETITPNKVRIRFPDNSRSEDIVSDIKKTIDNKTNQIHTENLISLKGIQNAAIRTKFFINMISKMERLSLYDVTKITVDSRMNDDEEAIAVDEDSIRQLVKKAALSGTNLLHSELYSELNVQGFYISRLGWQMLEEDSLDKIEFEAFFSDAPTCEKFACQVSGHYPSKGTSHTLTRKKLYPERERRFLCALESAAAEAYEQAVLEAKEEGDGPV